ncbi:NmrA-like domain-containing protein 1 [Aspergillus nanangensis]|uniref:NmrA-like domain-containing protein 1 n=1 Tax=Aspergillus nanangensis TaxID=2582783 RepID=A0AAD4GXS8_ASPNN|nr:NmrA-like domain-containing protein 1 [Aspergillus nanangensis]
MSKKLVIFGATGQQGHSMLTTVHEDPILSKQYSLRAITRDTSSATAQSIANKGIEVVQADVKDPATLPAALKDANTVILTTPTEYTPDLKEREYRVVKSVGDAAVAAGVEYFIFSTEVHCPELWNGRAVDSFDAKAEAEAYLRTLPLKTSFFAPGMFMQNLATVMAPRPAGDGTYVIANIMAPDAKGPVIDVVGDSGKYVASLLYEPEKSVGVTLYAASGLYSFAEMAQIISRVSGKTVKYVQLPEEVYAGFMPAEMGGRMVDMMRFIEEVGYYGPDTERLVEETVARVKKGKLTSLEEFAEKYLVDF